MKMRGLIVAAVVFCVLAAVLYWSDHHKPSDDTAKASGASSPAILKLDQNTISNLQFKKKGGEPVVLSKDGSGRWQIIQPRPLRADQETVDRALATLSSLNSERVVEDKASDLKQYGLDQPALEVDVAEKDNKTQALLIGDDTPTGSAVYATLRGDPRVFTMAVYNRASIDKGLEDLRNKKLFEFGFNAPDKIQMRSGSKTYSLSRRGTEWQSDGNRVDDASMQAFLSKLRDLAADKFVDSGFTVPAIEVTVSSAAGKAVEKVEISKSGNRYIARRAEDPTFYEVDSISIEQLQKAAEGIKLAAAPGK